MSDPVRGIVRGRTIKNKPTARGVGLPSGQQDGGDGQAANTGRKRTGISDNSTNKRLEAWRTP